MALYFTNLIEVLLKHVAVIARSIKLRLHVLAFMGLRLRDSCALYNAVHITEENVRDLETKCKEYFNASLLFCGKESITPTVWTIGYVVPFHTRKMYNTFGYGLGLNTMQGREAKHIKLAKYMENTSNVRKSQRWWTVFRHEYVSLVWLRQKDPANNNYKDPAAKQKDFIQNSFIPRYVQTHDLKYCYCGLMKANKDDEKCFICGHELSAFSASSAMDGKIHPALKSFID
jgi:hypothetical protein